MKKIIICPNEEKLNILEKIENNNELHSIKFMTKNEFINNYYFSYDTKTIYYLMNKYRLNIDVVKVYLNNLYFIDINKDYNNKKLLFLRNLKKELIDNKLLYFNNIFKEYIKDKSIEVINYYDLDKYLEKDINSTTEITKYNLNNPVHEFNMIEEEIEFICIKIRHLLDRGVNINNIYLTNVTEEYHYIISKMFSYYNIPINIPFKDSIYGSNIVNDYLKTKTLDLEDLNKSQINKKIISILEELVDIDENDQIYEKILIDKLKNIYLNNILLDNAVNIKELDKYTFNDDDYVFCLGFNLDSLPKTHKDIEYLSDRDKKEVDLYDTTYLNKREKLTTIYLLSRIKNLTITYKLSSPFGKYYPSNIISDLNLEVIKDHSKELNYSNTYNKLLLGEYLDKYNLYGEKDKNLDILYSNYVIKYNSYSNKYTNINKDLYLENISYPLRLSYTALNNYNECKFKYYINNVLRINEYTDTFQAFIGQMYHYILTLYKKSNFNLDEAFNTYLEKRDLSLKEKVLLVKIKKDLIDLIEILKKQQLITGYDDELYEKEIIIPLRDDIKVEFIGFIDKIMYYKNMDDTYFSIIDYKTGTIDTNIELMKYGLHMQLPVYLYLINYSNVISNPIFTGIYYQNILFNYPTWKKNIEKELNDRYLLKGYSTDNIEILERFDSTYEDSEYIKSMKYNPEKGFGTYTKIINDDEMFHMVKYVNNHIKEKTNSILDRDFEIDPKIYEGKNISCKFCTFKDLCFMTNEDIKYLDKVEDLEFLGGEEVMAFTPEQQEAITKEGTNIIVSAGAGSGKTAVLTERAKRKVLEGTSVNELLILTFTNAAAAEMKDRIREAIKNTPELKDELDLIDGAYITTFDAFSLAILKKYHTRLNITNNIKVTDEVIIDLKKKEILDEIFDENYLSPKKDFLKLIEDFSLKDDKELKDYILSVYKKIELKYDKTSFIENYFNIFNAEKINEFVEEYLDLIREKQNIIKGLIIELNNYFENDFVNQVEETLSKFVNANSYEEFLNSMDYKSVRIPKNSDEVGKSIKNEIFSILKELKEKYLIYDSRIEIENDLESTKENTKVIINIIKELDKRLDVYKRNEDVFTFNDIARLAIKVVEENKDIREELTNSFKEIMIDEYQDTSDTQEKFISLISNNNVYMVGDIKQSIYRFRNANPYIFKNKYDTYRDTDDGEKIDLLKNFRSRDTVLNNINLLFDFIMDDNLGGADYITSHRMVFGNTSYIEEGKTNQNYDLDVITYNEEELGKLSNSEEEAFIIGNDIKNKIESKFQIFDKSKKILRDCNYNDFVILLDRSKDFDLYKKVFEYLHIPLTILKEESLKKDNDILIIRNLLKLIISIKNNSFDNTFKYSFISLSRSFLYKISDEEIYNYFINNNYEDSELYQDALLLSQDLVITNPSRFFRELLEKANYEEKLLTINNIKQNRVRIEYIYNLIKEYEEKGNTIEDFISYLDQIIEEDYDLKFNVNSESSNSCKIMTIHKSKGLEYPICYFAGFKYKFNMNELKEKIIFDNYLGLIIPKVDNYYKDTILKILLKTRQKNEEISERIRLLYVAVTRAKEKIVIVMPKVDEDKEISNIIPLYEREKYNSFYSIMKSIYSILTPYLKESKIVGSKDYLNNNKETNLEKIDSKLEVKNLIIETQEILEKHYSKESLKIITKEEKNLLEFGTKVHELLEEIDFNNQDMINSIENNLIKEKIISFINSDLMKNYLDKTMYKEYEFIYTDENTISHGIIDLLIEDKDKCIIIDYKLKNILDPLYDKQLNGYKKYIESKTNKKCICYLYSLLNEEYREINYE